MLVSLRHVSFPAALRDGLRIDVRLVSLCHVSFPAALRGGLRIDVMLVSLCPTCFPPSLQERFQRRYTYGMVSDTLHSTAPNEERFRTSERHSHTGRGAAFRILEYLSLLLCRLVFKTHSDDPVEQMGPAECLWGLPYISPAERLQDSPSCRMS
jgi:hypothetical protein